MSYKVNESCFFLSHNTSNQYDVSLNESFNLNYFHNCKNNGSDRIFVENAYVRGNTGKGYNSTFTTHTAINFGFENNTSKDSFASGIDTNFGTYPHTKGDSSAYAVVSNETRLFVTHSSNITYYKGNAEAFRINIFGIKTSNE